MNSIKLQYKNGYYVYEFWKQQISDSYRLLLNLSGEINLNDKFVALSNVSIYCAWKNTKNLTKTIDLKVQLHHGTKNLNYLTLHIMYQIFKLFQVYHQKTWNSNW